MDNQVFYVKRGRFLGYDGLRDDETVASYYLIDGKVWSVVWDQYVSEIDLTNEIDKLVDETKHMDKMLAEAGDGPGWDVDRRRNEAVKRLVKVLKGVQDELSKVR